ncbi:MAG: prepilin-type N-terminal cleavage/methylation domain-containing protein [Leptolyngbyaceae cyanobacterium RU_5_1]|nr:prepilin-type N-terminal cleavage/methylation domain-containing protein [Leptolyngbyaceae cyanobacterium RU_5_1]
MKTWILRIRRKRSIAGFTLLEVLVVIIIVGILFAIAAPGWNALMNRQRVNTVRDQVVQIIRQAQNDARRTHIPRVVVFDSPADRAPRAAVLPLQLDVTTDGIAGLPVLKPTISNWQTLGNGDIRAGVLEFSTDPAPTKAFDQIVFDSNGAVAQFSLDNAKPLNASKPRIFAVKVRQKNTSVETERCVVVSTLLGGIRLAEGKDCEFPA